MHGCNKLLTSLLFVKHQWQSLQNVKYQAESADTCCCVTHDR
jgi:hypothetical protein